MLTSQTTPNKRSAVVRTPERPQKSRILTVDTSLVDGLVSDAVKHVLQQPRCKFDVSYQKLNQMECMSMIKQCVYRLRELDRQPSTNRIEQKLFTFDSFDPNFTTKLI
jgi:hypothetical protein